MNYHALVIGIDEYPLLRRMTPGGQPLGDLKGCVNDARRMAQVLCQRYLFPAAHVTLLINEQASREGILGGLADLLRRIDPGDVAVIFYAGHGSQMPDREKTKLSGWDETLVPHDSGRNEQPNRDITDDELRLWLLRFINKPSYVTLIFDCCYSATLHRNAFATFERAVPRDERAAEKLPPSPLTPDQIQQLQAAESQLPSQTENGAWLPSDDRYVVLAGCRADETAKEHSVYKNQQLLTHGALTYFLLDQIAGSAEGATYRDVFERTALEVSKHYEQHPSAEGALDRALFGVNCSPPPPYFLVTKVRNGIVTIAGGQSQGVERGSEWALFPPGAREFQVTTQPRVRITSVTPRSAQGQLLSTDFIIAEYSRAVLVQRPLERKWQVQLIGTPPLATARPEEINNPGVPQLYINKLLANSAWLRAATDEAPAQIQVYLLAPRAAVEPGAPLPQLGPLPSETWAVVDAAGELCMKPLHVMQIARLTASLEQLARQEFLKELHNPESNLRGLIDLRLLVQDANQKWVPLHPDPAAIPAVNTGTRLVIELVNRHTAPLYVAMLQLDADGAVTQIYPPAGTSEPLRPQGTSRIGDGEGNWISTRIPAALPLRANGQPPSEALCGFKLFVTTQPVDLRPLLQPGVRAAQPEFRGSASALGRLLQSAFFGGSQLRAKLGREQIVDEWTADGRWLRVVK